MELKTDDQLKNIASTCCIPKDTSNAGTVYCIYASDMLTMEVGDLFNDDILVSKCYIGDTCYLRFLSGAYVEVIVKNGCALTIQQGLSNTTECERLTGKKVPLMFSTNINRFNQYI